MNQVIPSSPLAECNVALLRQGADLVRTLDPEVYRNAPPQLARGGVGAHLRHILDHYDRLFDGLAGGRVDYDRRARDPETEVRPARAVERIEALVARLEDLPPDSAGRTLAVAMDSGERDDDESGWTESSLGRELQYLLAHTVHHYALIGVILSLAGVEAGPEFGVAPSTLRHERDARCAR